MSPQTKAGEPATTSTAWIPEQEGDRLAGTVREVRDAWSDQRQGHYPLLVIADGDGEVRTLHAFTTVLYNEVMRKRPMPGDRIEVEYLGLSGSAKPGQNPAKRYRVSVPGKEGEQAERAYARLGGESEPLAPPEPDPDVPVDGRGLEADIPF